MAGGNSTTQECCGKEKERAVLPGAQGGNTRAAEAKLPGAQGGKKKAAEAKLSGEQKGEKGLNEAELSQAESNKLCF